MTSANKMSFLRIFFLIPSLAITNANNTEVNVSTPTNGNETKLPSTSGGTTPLPLEESIRDIAYYLRAHKFNEYDRRYITNMGLAKREYYEEFPRPPLRSLHWEVHKNCEESFDECVKYLKRKVKDTGSKRTDDTSVVIEEQDWFDGNHSAQIETVDKECNAMREQDDVQANPFEGPLERYQWRTTAAYFMCWYTMRGQWQLRTLHESCDNFAACLDPEFGAHNHDFRANDHVDYACALYSFCPDPCCPSKHETSEPQCWDKPINPCYAGNARGRRHCLLDRGKNVDFRSLVLNRWNVSCACVDKGYEWNSLYGMCVDVDECAISMMANDSIGMPMGGHKCDRDTEVCINSPGTYRCSCKWGHVRDAQSKVCKPSKALLRFVLNRQTQPEVYDAESNSIGIWSKIVRFFGRKSSPTKTANGCGDLIDAAALLVCASVIVDVFVPGM